MASQYQRNRHWTELEWVIEKASAKIHSLLFADVFFSITARTIGKSIQSNSGRDERLFEILIATKLTRAHPLDTLRLLVFQFFLSLSLDLNLQYILLYILFSIIFNFQRRTSDNSHNFNIHFYSYLLFVHEHVDVFALIFFFISSQKANGMYCLQIPCSPPYTSIDYIPITQSLA